MNWRRAVLTDAPALAALATATSTTPISPADAATFLQAWHVELTETSGVAQAAVAVLPPTPGHHRGYGAWWSRNETSPDLISRLVALARSTPGVHVLQVAVDADKAVELQAQQFIEAYPLWTMTHDNATWPSAELPAPLRTAHWRDVSPADFQTAYEESYRDQRLVEPHAAEALHRLTSDNSFAADLSSVAVSPDGAVAAFVLAFTNHHGGVELGPIGTLPPWRGRGASSALLSTTLTRSRAAGLSPITLIVDGNSPTGAHRLYLRHGFQRTNQLHAYQLRLPTPR